VGGLFWADAMRAMERNAEQKKPDLKTWTACGRVRAGQPTLVLLSSEASKHGSDGTNGAHALADPADPDQAKRLDGMKDACELAR
jgi:hypothetical protein